MQWGFPRFDGKGLVINARSESVMEKPMFAGPFSSYRCLFPASFYFEWRNEGLRKTKYRMYQPGAPLIWLAGLAKDYRDGTPPKFVILTRPAAASIGFVHDRMPLILPQNTHDAWLFGDKYDAISVMGSADREIVALPA